MNEKLALYFGFGSGGHFLWGVPGRESFSQPERVPGFPWTMELLDCGLLKNSKVPDRVDGRVHWTCGGQEALWFAFFWWDRSGDSRPGSNSGFYVRGFELREREQAFRFACEQWPNVVARQKTVLVLQ